VFLTGGNLGNVEAVAEEIVAAHGKAEAGQVDALDEKAIEHHLSSVTRDAGRIDISFNAITPVPQPGVQGVPIAKLPVGSFTAPIAAYTRSHFLTARAAARRMVEKSSGVILMHTPEPARLGAALVGGMGPAWAAMEAFNRNLSAEFGAHTAFARSASARRDFPRPKRLISSLVCTPPRWASRQSNSRALSRA